MSKLAVLNTKGKQQESIDLPSEIFGARVNEGVVHQAIVKYQASLRQGNASTKDRGEVSGGGKKPYRQKGTGRARAGSSRSPLWRGGGVTFGPRPRDFAYSIPKKVRKVALRECLNAKLQSEELFCLDDLTAGFEKTKDFAAMLKGLGLTGKILAALDGSHENIQRVSRNIPGFNLMRAQDINAYDVLKYKNLLLTKTALNSLLDRVKI